MTRFLSFRQAVLAAAVLTLLGASPALAGPTVPLRGSGTGQVIRQVNPTPQNPVGELEYVVQGNMTLLGRVTARGTSFFTPDLRRLPTSFYVARAADGSTITGRYSGTVTPIPGTPNFAFADEVVWGEGTGRLAGVTGRSRLTGVLNGLTGAFVWEHRGVWIRP
jgi:hypothetical protein